MESLFSSLVEVVSSLRKEGKVVLQADDLMEEITKNNIGYKILRFCHDYGLTVDQIREYLNDIWNTNLLNNQVNFSDRNPDTSRNFSTEFTYKDVHLKDFGDKTFPVCPNCGGALSKYLPFCPSCMSPYGNTFIPEVEALLGSINGETNNKSQEK